MASVVSWLLPRHRWRPAGWPGRHPAPASTPRPAWPQHWIRSPSRFSPTAPARSATASICWLASACGSYPEAVDIALCWGWIDGQKKGFDDAYFLQRFTPRRPRSVWSKTNKAKVAALIEAGRMQAPGQAQVDAAQADGRWARAYDGARTATVPDELQAALTGCPPAQAFFSTLNASQRYAVIWRVQTAVRPETRARRVAELVEKLARGELVHIFKPKSPVQAAADSGSGS